MIRSGCCSGPGAVLHAILNQVVKDYDKVLDALEDDVLEVERKSSPSVGDLERIYRLKQEVMSFQFNAEPLVEPCFASAGEDYAAIDPKLKPYFRDVHDHLLRVVDRIHGYRDMLASMLAANLTQVSLRQNEDMRKISAYVADRGGPHLSRRDLGDELRVHARDRRSLGIPSGPGNHGRGLHIPLHPVQEVGLALR